MYEVVKCLFVYIKSKLKKSRFFFVYKKIMKCVVLGYYMFLWEFFNDKFVYNIIWFFFFGFNYFEFLLRYCFVC